jgi:predicted nucleotidyltransferase
VNEEAIIAFLREQLPELLAVYLFGSRASGEANARSDLDLAVLNDGPLDPVGLWDLAGEVEDIALRPVDLVDLRAASTVMQYQIVAKGRRLWARDVRAGLYEAFILSEKTALDERRAGLLEDIAREGRVYGR